MTLKEVFPIDEIMDPNKVYYDDITGKVLDTKAVIGARMEEIEGIRTFEVYNKVPRAMAYERTGKKPIAVRWVDVNKGDEVSPEIRCRLVAKEINDHKRMDLFAATPPLEALKLLMSLACTEKIGYQAGHRDEGMKLDFIDVKKAYYSANARRELYIELPEGDREPGMVGNATRLSQAQEMQHSAGSMSIRHSSQQRRKKEDVDLLEA